MQGGFSISDEMCVNYIHYFPKQELEVCKSSVTTYSLYEFFQVLQMSVASLQPSHLLKQLVS